ncbi:MAG TPA: alpha-mannosidase [Providencia sp.]|uniref:glycoside hydrolase family 38 N-terminal domain-containing protein n=1 Tax=Providencia sp. TaxID=589 RepID=UPI000E91E9D0|nr:glycoside hydrolase family 38 C-terminal domain-containing protein [Providencia sp.]HBO21335.1 alpha-mannosidase [Providencia sp.]
MKTVHLIQHTHWDREWYFTENDSKIILYYFMNDLMDRLEQDTTLGPFILDGQTVVLEDYLKVAPKQCDRLKQLIKQGRILIGPWYTQTDFLVVGAESIARNLLLGKADCETWGSYMPVGYVPDSFGQSAQLPMFLQQFDIKYAVIWRGWCERDVASSEFIWRADSGDSVTTAVLPWGYGCAKWLPDNTEKASTVLPAILEKQARFAHSEQILLPNGNDQSPFEYAVPAMLNKLNEQQKDYHFVKSSFSDFFTALQESGQQLPEFSGELLSPKYMRVHRGIFSTRMDIKLLNVKLEQFVSQQLEPLLSINWRLGLPYPQSAVENIWRDAMQSHAHDSIGGCNSDRVNSMVKARLTNGLESANQLLSLNMKMLAGGIEATQKGKKIIVFNSLPHQRDAQISITLYTPEADFCIKDDQGKTCRWQLIKEQPQDMSLIVQELANSTTTTWYRKCDVLLEATDLPSCGYRTFYLHEGEPANFELPLQIKNENTLENQWLKIEINDGQLRLIDKRNQQHYSNILRLVDGGDAGDNYNYSPPVDDWLVSSDGHLQQFECIRAPLIDAFILDWHIPAPLDAKARQQHQLNAYLDISMKISLPHDKPWLDIEITVNNTIQDHRLQIEIPTEIQQAFHFADQPFGLIKRENQPTSLAYWQEENWTEAPTSLWPMQSLVMQHNDNHGICLVTEGLREYQIPESRQDMIALTLLRSVGWLGQANLTWRPGRASGMVLPSPDSQIFGIHHFHFAVLPMHQGQHPDFWRDVEHWRTPAFGYLDSGWSQFKMNPHDLVFPESYSLLTWDCGLHFSTLKKAQNVDALVLRGWNPSIEPLLYEPPKSDIKIQQVTLAETECVNAGKAAPCAPVSWLMS